MASWLRVVCCVAFLSGCNVAAEIELYSADLAPGGDASEVAGTVAIKTFGDRSMCSLLQSEAATTLARIFSKTSFRECQSDDNSMQTTAVFEVGLPVIRDGAAQAARGKAHIEVSHSDRLSTVRAVTPPGGTQAGKGGMFDFSLTSDVEPQRTVSFRVINADFGKCSLSATSAYVNGIPQTMPKIDTAEILRRKSIMVRLSDVAIDKLVGGGAVDAFYIRCEN